MADFLRGGVWTEAAPEKEAWSFHANIPDSLGIWMPGAGK